MGNKAEYSKFFIRNQKTKIFFCIFSFYKIAPLSEISKSRKCCLKFLQRKDAFFYLHRPFIDKEEYIY